MQDLMLCVTKLWLCSRMPSHLGEGVCRTENRLSSFLSLVFCWLTDLLEVFYSLFSISVAKWFFLCNVLCSTLLCRSIPTFPQVFCLSIRWQQRITCEGTHQVACHCHLKAQMLPPFFTGVISRSFEQLVHNSSYSFIPWKFPCLTVILPICRHEMCLEKLFQRSFYIHCSSHFLKIHVHCFPRQDGGHLL